MQDEARQVDPPLGIFPAKVDDKGRLKLPGEFHSYLQALGATKTFVTTLDKATCKIYTIPAWNANVRYLDGADDKVWARGVKFRAADWGQLSELDAAGRVMLPTNLRRHLQMENAQVFLQAGDGVIEVSNEAAYRAQQRRSDEVVDADPDRLLQLR